MTRADRHHASSHCSSMARRKALADALAGVIASLTSLWAFYPVDVYKTHLQATHHHRNQTQLLSSRSSSLSIIPSNNKNYRFVFPYLIRFFRGVHVKSWHTVASNFCYFYLESWMTSRWIILRNRRRPFQDDRHPTKKQSLSPLEHLILSALAAMLNTCLTLPLDVISLQSQAVVLDIRDDDEKDSINKRNEHPNGQTNEHQSRQLVSTDTLRQAVSLAPPTLAEQTMDDVWNSLEDPLLVVGGSSDQAGSDGSNNNSNEVIPSSINFERSEDQEEKKDDRAPLGVSTSSPLRPKKSLLTTSSTTSLHDASHSSNYMIRRLAQLGSLWKGLVPSLLLCSNPSIHYTVYDLLKTYLLVRQQRLGNSASSNSKLITHLTWAQSFKAGIMAKLTATLITYPLIRAKVLLIMKQSTTTATTPTAPSLTQNGHDDSSNSLMQCLTEQYQQHGLLAGWYRGCSIQILHTVLKSALVMMIREQIMELVHGWLRVQQPK